MKAGANGQTWTKSLKGWTRNAGSIPVASIAGEYGCHALPGAKLGETTGKPANSSPPERGHVMAYDGYRKAGKEYCPSSYCK